MIKKTAAVLSALIMVLCAMLTSVSAAPMVTLGQNTIPAPGQEFAVSVVLVENPGLSSIQVMVNYDSKSASLLYCGDGGFFDQFNTIPTDGGVILMWSSTAGNDNYSTGTLATIVFTASENPTNNSLISASVLAATNTAGNSVTINNSSNILQFNLSSGVTDDDDVIADVDDDDIVSDDDDIIIAGDDDEVLDDDIISADDDEEVVTTATTKATKATTTTKKTSATTTTKATTTTQATTTTKVTTTTEEITTPVTTTTTEETTSETVTTTEDTTPAVTETTPESSQSESVKFSGDAATAQAQKKMANGGTVFAAVMIVGVTVAAIVGMRVWKKEQK